LNGNINLEKNRLKETMCQWITNNENDLVETTFKYYIMKHFDEFMTIEKVKENHSFIEALFIKAINVKKL